MKRGRKSFQSLILQPDQIGQCILCDASARSTMWVVFFQGFLQIISGQPGTLVFVKMLANDPIKWKLLLDGRKRAQSKTEERCT
jgi:uncharacterized protein YlaI